MNNTLRTIAWLAALMLGVALSALQLNAAKTRPAALGSHNHAHGEEHRPHRIFNWEPEEAQALTLRSGDGRELHFERIEAKWHSRGTPTAEASDFDPAAYLAMLSQARKDREFLPETDSLATFGLAPAQMHVLVRNPSGDLIAELAVGELTPDGFGRYVLTPPAASVLIIPNYQFEPAIRSLPQ